MRSARTQCLVLLAINAAWLVLLHGGRARLAACAGAALAALLWARSDRASGTEWPRWPLALFLAPVLTLVKIPVVVFWRIDGGVLLILAWLVTCATHVLHSGERTRDVSARARSRWPLLVFCWSSALWLTVVADLGVQRYALNTDRFVYKECQSDPLAVNFTVWEHHPASEHLFIAWRTLGDFDARRPYANHVHPYLLSMYVWERAVRGLAGLSLYQATNSVPFLYVVVLVGAVASLLWRTGILSRTSGALFVLLLFLGSGTIVTGWRFWHDMYRFSTDNPYPLLAAVLVVVYACLLEPVRPIAAAVAGALFVALSPIHTPMLIAAAACLFGAAGRDLRDVLQRNRPLVVMSIVWLIVGGVTYATPWLLVQWKGYSGEGSGILFRSGLDGDKQYFTSLIQAVVAPCPVLCCWGRPFSSLMWPAFVPVAFSAPVLWFRRISSPASPARLFAFLAAPYLITLLLFPQSISIHPYLYDHFLIEAAVVTGAVVMIDAVPAWATTGTRLFGALLLLCAVLMANLVAIAQALAGMPR